MYGPLDISALQGRVFWKCNWSKFNCEKVEKEFEYCSVADERSDTKVLKGGAYFIPSSPVVSGSTPNGDTSPTHGDARPVHGDSGTLNGDESPKETD